MAKERISVEELGFLIRLVDGKLFWNPRDGVAGTRGDWNGRFADKEVGCLDTSTGYIKFTVYNVKYYYHRALFALAYGRWPEEVIDHINGNTSDNRLENLRETTHQQNICNVKISVNNTSGYKGVVYHKPTKQWTSGIMHLGVRHHLGYFDSALEASEAYSKKEVELRKEFIRGLDATI